MAHPVKKVCIGYHATGKGGIKESRKLVELLERKRRKMLQKSPSSLHIQNDGFASFHDKTTREVSIPNVIQAKTELAAIKYIEISARAMEIYFNRNTGITPISTVKILGLIILLHATLLLAKFCPRLFFGEKMTQATFGNSFEKLVGN